MNALTSIKSKFVALIAVLILAIAVVPAQASNDVNVKFTVQKVITIQANLDLDRQAGTISVSILGVPVSNVRVSANNATVNLVDINFMGISLDMRVRVHWVNESIDFRGEACAYGDCSTFTRAHRWGTGY